MDKWPCTINTLSPVYFGFAEGAEVSRDRHHKFVADSVQSLGIKPRAMEEPDPRPKWSTSVNAAAWEGTGSTPAERNAKFLEIMSYVQGVHLPMEGTSIVATYPNPDDPLFMRVVIKVSPETRQTLP